MGLSGVSVPQLLVILVIVLVIFGTKRMKSFGGDLGTAIRSFRNAVNRPDADDVEAQPKELTGADKR